MSANRRVIAYTVISYSNKQFSYIFLLFCRSCSHFSLSHSLYFCVFINYNPSEIDRISLAFLFNDIISHLKYLFACSTARKLKIVKLSNEKRKKIDRKEKKVQQLFIKTVYFSRAMVSQLRLLFIFSMCSIIAIGVW